MGSAVGSIDLLERCNRKLSEFVQNVDNRDFVWLREIHEEAIKMFSSNVNDEPQLMPKTPSQKNRRKKKRSSIQDNNNTARKRLSRRRDNSQKASSKRFSQRLQDKEDLEIIRAIVENGAPIRLTRSRVTLLAAQSALSKKPVKGRVPLVEISVNERHSAELQLKKSLTQAIEKDSSIICLSSDDESTIKAHVIKSQPASTVSLLVIPETPEAKRAREGRGASKLKIEVLSQHLKDGTGTPTGSKSNRRSVRRSLIGRTSMNRRTSLATRFSLASKRESMIRESVRKRKSARKSSLATGRVEKLRQIPVRTGSFPVSRLLCAAMSSPTAATAAAGGNAKAVGDLYDGQHTEDNEFCSRKKTPSPLCPASKVVRPFKTFLHTVQKNQLLMTPSSVGRSSVMKSFIKHNTPIRTDPKAKERQRLENLRKKQEAEQQRKQKLEEEKRRRLEEMKIARIVCARERVEQMEEEKKRRIEQNLAQHDEKSEKVREERMAEEKVRKKAAARKVEEAEARRRQEEEARKQKALKLVSMNSPACNSYQMTPQGPKRPKIPSIDPDNYGMDLNSDDSTDDESNPRKAIPAWASGAQLSQAVIHQYYKPPNVDALFGVIKSPKLENIFYKNKPRYFKRTSSAVWNSPPFPGAKVGLGLPYSLKKF
uniref:Inner centromere protein n=2 Tax=Sphenodon punctatus TaxID=8508 RepID=A0A8D0GK58_SPHPU